MPSTLRRLWSARRRLHVAALSRLNLIEHVNFVATTRISDRPFRIPVTSGVGASHMTDAAEPWLDRVIADCQRAGAFVDVGVNLGQTLLKVKALHPKAEYWGFEPSPQSYCYAMDLIRVNRFSSCHLYPVGLSDRAAILHLVQRHDTDPCASLVPAFREESMPTAQSVPVFRGDDILDQAKTIAMVKIDVEGGELEVLLGLKNTLMKHRPVIVCEVLPVYDETTRNGRFRLDRQQRLEDLLRELNYEVRRIEPDGTTEKIDRIGVHKDIERVNYMFAP